MAAVAAASTADRRESRIDTSDSLQAPAAIQTRTLPPHLGAPTTVTPARQAGIFETMGKITATDAENPHPGPRSRHP
jgi:hypothetical protein